MSQLTQRVVTLESALGDANVTSIPAISASVAALTASTVAINASLATINASISALTASTVTLYAAAITATRLTKTVNGSGYTSLTSSGQTVGFLNAPFTGNPSK